ncbi:hypothetical protein IQ238_26135 [Pleurocapsales cyanobacterium LEGE 06147]|nr:hypothetical protein [Pleurocapsales cyanobacterium LEGE 06147]
MSLPTSWQCLSVEEFFSDSNWQGNSRKINLQLQTEQNLSLPETPLQLWSREFWQCLTVEQLFSNSYLWGAAAPATQDRSLASSDEPIPTSLSLVSPVNQFFRCFIWKGKPKIAAIPKLEPVFKTTELSANHLKLNDFTDLF